MHQECSQPVETFWMRTSARSFHCVPCAHPGTIASASHGTMEAKITQEAQSVHESVCIIRSTVKTSQRQFNCSSLFGLNARAPILGLTSSRRSKGFPVTPCDTFYTVGIESVTRRGRGRRKVSPWGCGGLEKCHPGAVGVSKIVTKGLWSCVRFHDGVRSAVFVKFHN